MAIVSGSIYVNRDTGYIEYEIEVDMSVEEFEYLSVEEQCEIVVDGFADIYYEYGICIEDESEVYIENIDP